jgi:hypothetical protein
MTAHTRSFDDLSLAGPQPRVVARAQGGARRRPKGNSPEYLLVFSACFVVFVAVLALEALLPASWRKISDSIGARSFLTRARAAAHRYTAIAFQG